MAKRLILGSSSPYRRQILEKLGLPFRCISPDIDETAGANEAPDALVTRLARKKAETVAKAAGPGCLIITSDQVASLDGQTLTKPGNHQNAVKQLQMCSGRTVVFHTSLCLYNSDLNNSDLNNSDLNNSDADSCYCCSEQFKVHFRRLGEAEIENYLRREQPYDCAGSFKSEGLGICLFERLEGDDPNTLIGLPLIRLTKQLIAQGLNPLLLPPGQF